MAFDFLDIVMEAKGKKPIKISPDENYEKTDYTDDIEEETDEQEDDELDNQEETPEDDNLESEEDDIPDDEDEGEPTDYTETEEELGDEFGDDDFGEDGEGEASDYTSDGDEAGGDDTETTDDTDEPSDYTDDSFGDDSGEGDEASPEESMEEGEEGPTSEDRKNKALLEDLIQLKEMVGNFIDKTSSINGNEVSKVKFTNQLNNNLNLLSKQIHNYIVYRFSRESYVRNLYFYNYSVEALNISINMLKKINGFKHNK